MSVARTILVDGEPVEFVPVQDTIEKMHVAMQHAATVAIASISRSALQVAAEGFDKGRPTSEVLMAILVDFARLDTNPELLAEFALKVATKAVDDLTEGIEEDE